MPATPESSIKTLGVIAGGGTLPERLLHVCDSRGTEVFVVGFEGQTDPALTTGRRHMLTRIGAAGRIINTLKSHGIRDLVFIGSIRRPSLAELRPDMRTARFFARIGMKALGDNGLFGALRAELESDGFTIHGIQDFAQDLLATKGPVGGPKPGRADLANIKHGVDVAREMGRLDIGQSVIVQEGIVLGVEAAEGTDELIRRCGGYRRKGHGGVLVKLSKPGQDRDFDLPTVGPKTVELCAQAGLAGIALHAGHCLLVDPQEVAALADRHKIFVIGIDPDEQ